MRVTNEALALLHTLNSCGRSSAFRKADRGAGGVSQRRGGRLKPATRTCSALAGVVARSLRWAAGRGGPASVGLQREDADPM